MNSIVRNKQKIFQQQIRSKFLNDYFQEIRLAKLRQMDFGQEMDEEEIVKFMGEFPKSLEGISFEAVSQNFIERLAQCPHSWLQNYEGTLNLCQWSSLVQLLIKILSTLKIQSNSINLLQSARRYICHNFTKRLSSNKIMKKQILRLILDLFVQIRTVINSLHEEYHCLMDEIFTQVLNLKWQQNQFEVIKVLAICNKLILNGQITHLTHKIYGKQKINLVKMFTFMQEHCFSCHDVSNTLIQIIVISLVNYTQECVKDKYFYRIFDHNKFKHLIRNCLSLGTHFRYMELLLKLIYNLIVDDSIFACWFSDNIDFNRAHMLVERMQQQLMLQEVERLLQKKSMMSV